MTMDMCGTEVDVYYHIDRFANLEISRIDIGNQDVQDLFQEYGMIYDVFHECLGQGNDE
jgi:hypothetical protein